MYSFPQKKQAKGLKVRIYTVLLLLLTVASRLPAAKTLDVYVIDVEGGKAMLVVTPAGQSMLLDAGWPGIADAKGRMVKPDDRDADRIVEVVKATRVKQIDYLVVTHYDTDHVENVPRLVSKLPIRVQTFVDHGSPVVTSKTALGRIQPYLDLREKAKHVAVKPGERIPMKGLDVRVVTSGGEVIKTPLAGAAVSNDVCAGTPKPSLRRDENEAGVGLLFTYGKFRMIDLADLLQGKEYELMCPSNPVGAVDVFMVNAHGLAVSNSQVLVHGLRPRVAIMNNGARKGGEPSVWKVLRSAPGIEDIWQVHYSLAADKDSNPPSDFIGNLTEEADCQAKWLKLSARTDGTFTVFNSRNGFAKTYRPRQ